MSRKYFKLFIVILDLTICFSVIHFWGFNKSINIGLQGLASIIFCNSILLFSVGLFHLFSYSIDKISDSIDNFYDMLRHSFQNRNDYDRYLPKTEEERLIEQLNISISKEDYEKAAKIRNQLDRLYIKKYNNNIL
jgi:hypothetical protein